MNEQIVCPQCNQKVTVPNLNVSVVNNPDVSFMYVTHVEGIECACGTYLLPAIIAMQPGVFGWVPAERPDTKRVITPILHLAH